MRLHMEQPKSIAVVTKPAVIKPAQPKAAFAKEKPLVDDQKINGIVVPAEIVIEDMRRRWGQTSDGSRTGVELELPVPSGKGEEQSDGHGEEKHEIVYRTPVPETVPRGVHQEPMNGPDSDNVIPTVPKDDTIVRISFI